MITRRAWLGYDAGHSYDSHMMTFQYFCAISVNLDLKNPERSSSCIIGVRETAAMKRMMYRGYTIVATARNHRAGWRSHVRVSWKRGQEKIELQGEKSFKTEREAEEYALALGRHWVINRLQIMLFRKN
jgi:hypothetical protein